jgi:hypothetical protein
MADLYIRIYNKERKKWLEKTVYIGCHPYCSSRVVRMMTLKILKWAEHVACMEAMLYVYRALFGNLCSEKSTWKAEA